tara:strand:- start:16130 stop:17539 length:1410 start_codon:yes stop_codon:yes gene_type:complete
MWDKGFQKKVVFMDNFNIKREIELLDSCLTKCVKFDTKFGDLIELIIPHTVYPPREDSSMMIEAIDLIKGEVGRVVEIGVGSGALSIALAQRGWSVEGFDLNPISVASARGNVKRNDFEDLISIEEGGPGFDDWELPECDLLIWNLPYLTPPQKNEPRLGPLEELGLSDLDIEGGWSNLIREKLEQYEWERKPMVLILFRTFPRSPSDPKEWRDNGWSERTLVKRKIGDETLEAVALWKIPDDKPSLFLESIDSTMDYAKNIDSDWGRIRVENQTSGRGRNNSEWESEYGDLIATWSVDNQVLKNTNSGSFQLCVGACIAKTIGADLKWPNDIFSNGKKLGGVLIETSSDQEKIRVGLGMNKYPRKIKGVEATGWTLLEPKIEAQELFIRIDAALNSWIGKNERLPFIKSIEMNVFSWKIMSKSLSKGVISNYESAFRICGIDDDGGLVGVDSQTKFTIDSLEKLIISF